MRRRTFLSMGALAGVAGCSEIEALDLGTGTHSVGDTVDFDGIEITPIDAMSANTIEVVQRFETREISSPSNGVFGLFEIEAYNTDITERDLPYVNTRNYELMELDENEFSLGGVNDIRVYGSGEGGHLPNLNQIGPPDYRGLRVNNNDLDTYPSSPDSYRPSRDPESTATGWVFAVISAESTPELRVVFREQSATWTAEGTSLDTPTEGPTVLPM